MADNLPPIDMSQYGDNGSASGLPGLDMSQFDQNAPQLTPQPQRGVLGEIGAGFARGALVDLPTMTGQALQYAGATSTGQGLVSSATARGQQSWLTLNPEQHGSVVNALAGGAEALGAFAPALVAGGAAALAGAPALVAGGLAVGIPGALAAGQAGETTLEKAQAKGIAPDQARIAAGLNAATTFATQVGLGLAGGRVLGIAGSALGKVIGADAAPLAGDVLGQLTGQGGVLGATAKAAGVGALEATTIGATQAGASAGIEQHYGIDDTNPLTAALDTIPTMLGMTAILSPLGLASRALGARAAVSRTATLAHPETDPALRGQLADQYAQALAAPGTPEAKQASANFRENAQTAIDNKQALPVSTQLFDQGAVQAPTPPNPIEGQINPGANLPTEQVINQNAGVAPPTTEAAQAQRQADITAAYNEPSGVRVSDPTTGAERELPMGELMEMQAGGQLPAASPTPEAAQAVNDTVDTLHGQVQDQLQAAGVEPAQPMTRQQFNEANNVSGQEGARAYQAYLDDPTTQDALLQENVQKYANTPEAQTNTQLGDSLSAALRQQQIDHAYDQVAARREAETNAIANQTNGAALADAAARGEVTPDVNAPKTVDNISDDVNEVNQAQGFDTKPQSMVPFQKRLDALGLDQMPDHATQISALDAYLADKNVKMSDAVRDRFSALSEMWKNEQSAPAEPTPVDTPQAVAAEGTPVAAPAPAAHDLGTNIEQSPISHAQDTANMVDATLAQFNDRIRNGETLPPLEQERMEDLQGMRQSLAEVTSGDNANEAYAQSISDLARDAATKPYTTTYRRYEVGNPEAVDPGIMLDSLRTGKLADTLNTIGEQGSTPEVQALAQRLAPLVPDTTLKYAGPDGSGAVGDYNRQINHVNIYPGGESEQTILHEAVHAATVARLVQAETMGRPRTQDEARLKSAYNEIESIRNEVNQRVGGNVYGLTNAHEFVAELNTNPDFQQTLKDAATQGKPSLWTRAVNAVKNLLGMQQDGDYLSRAMQANEAFFEQNPNKAGFPLPPESAPYQRFLKTPQDAADVTDQQYGKLAGLANDIASKIAPKLNINNLSLSTYQKMLGWVTKQYIVDRLAARPEMQTSGMADAAAAHYKADETKRVVTESIQHPLAQYVTGLRKITAALKDGDKARALEQQMMVLGGESSRLEYDPTKNFNDNVKAGRNLDVANKAYIDDMHRQFTQLQSTNPDAAKAIVDGALQNAREHTMRVATLAHGLIDASQNAAMAPHSAALDIMDPKLASARNTDAARYADGSHNALNDRLEQAFSAARNLPEGTMLRDQLGELSDLYHAQARNPYFSLGRSGDYFTKLGFQNMDQVTADKLQAIALQHGHVLGNLMGDADHAFFRVDSLDEAKGLLNKLTQAGGDKITPNTGASGMLAARLDSAFGVSPALRSILSSLHEAVEQQHLTGPAADAMRDTITRQVLALLPETSSRSAKMQRRGIPGYSADFASSFVRRASGGVQDLANMYMQPTYTSAREAMDTAIEKLARSGQADAQTRAQMAANEINTRHTNLQKPVDNSIINTINSLGHTFFLAASPAYLIRTMAQPYHRGVPITGARYGFVNASRSMAGATGTALKIIGNTISDGYSDAGLRGVLNADASFKNLGLPANEQNFIQELHDRGELNLGQARQLQAMPLAGSQIQQDLQRMASMTAQYAEMGNRLVVALSAFRLAEADDAKKGVTSPDRTSANTEWAIKVAKQAMDDFVPTNTARNISKNAPITGKITPLLTSFMNYNLQTMQQISRTVQDGMFNKDQSPAGLQRATEAKKEFGYLMATTAMISGAMGLPFANVFAGIYNTVFNDPNDPHDIRIDAQKFMENNFGHTVGGVLSHGLPHAAGFDSSTFGLENLLPGSEFLASRQLLKDRLADQSTALMGPALNAGVGLVEAADKFSDGFYVKGIEAALPSGLKPYFKAAELATNGYTDSKGNPIGITATPWDVALQAAGFRSTKAATQQENQQFVSARQDRLNYQRGLIEDQFFKGANGNQDAANNALGMLGEFNQANPTQPIRDIGQSIRARMIGLALAQSSGTGVNLVPRQLPTLGQQLLLAQDPFAAMP